MVRLLASAVLVARLACQRLDFSWELCLQAWLNHPVIEVVLEDPGASREALIRRVDAMYPF